MSNPRPYRRYIKTFQPEVDQGTLALMIIREQLAWNYRGKDGIFVRPSPDVCATDIVAKGLHIVLSDGTLSDLGLPADLDPHNPAGLDTGTITDGGNWRCGAVGDRIPEEGAEFWHPYDAKWYAVHTNCAGLMLGVAAGLADITIRLPVAHPLPERRIGPVVIQGGTRDFAPNLADALESLLDDYREEQIFSRRIARAGKVLEEYRKHHPKKK